MKMQKPFLLALLIFLSAGLFSADAKSLSGRRPNIIFILTDDQGYGDISANGSPILKTPNMDRIHDEGVRFTDFHVSPTCSPTRSALMTGRHEFRNGVTHTIFERERMTLDAVTIAEVLKDSGYRTGIFGKWHLGDEPAYQPDRRGFEEVFIHGGGGIGQRYPGSCADAPGNSYFSPFIKHNGKFVKTEGYCTDVFFKRAIDWVGRVKGGGDPFFAYIATNAPHGPLHVPESYSALYAEQVKDPDVAKFYGMIANLDENVGKLLDALADMGLEKNTLVILMNDNGGSYGCKIFNAEMRGGKATPYLGGTRAFSFWRWPGTLSPAEVGNLTAHIDFFPTLSELAGVPLDGKVQAQVEGRSLVPLLQGESSQWPDRTLFTHVARWNKGANPDSSKYNNCAVRTKDFQLVCTGKGEKKEWQLYDLRSDFSQAVDVAAQNPVVAKKMALDFEKWWASVRPMMVNENAVGPDESPFWTEYLAQFGNIPAPNESRKEPSIFKRKEEH